MESSMMGMPPVPSKVEMLAQKCQEARIKASRSIVPFIILPTIASLCAVVAVFLNVLAPSTLVIFVFVSIVAFVFRIGLRSEVKVPIGGMRPSYEDGSFAQIMKTVFKSKEVRYFSNESGRVGQADKLPFPLPQTRGLVAYRFGKFEVVPLAKYVLVFDGVNVKAVPEEKIEIDLQIKEFTVEAIHAHAGIPIDAKIIHEEKKYTTKKGLPDLRYKTNPNIVTYQVGALGIVVGDIFSGVVSFSSAAGYVCIQGMISKRYGTHGGQTDVGTERKQPSVPAGIADIEYYKLIKNASLNLIDFIRELCQDTQGQEMIERDGFAELDQFGCILQFNPRFGMLFYRDICTVFKNLGWSTEECLGKECLGFIIVVSQLFKCGIDINMLSNSEYFSATVPGLIKCVNDLRISVEADGQSVPLALHKLLADSANREFAEKYATLMYRWASIIAKADGKITLEESNCLAELMKLKNDKGGCNVRVSGSVENVSNATVATHPSTVQEGQQLRKMKKPDQYFFGLIGMHPVRAEVLKLASFIEIQRMRQNKGLRTAEVSYHCVFTGSPGTGKTTVARILANIYRDLGVIKKGHLVETDRSGLVAEYLGQTAVKTNKIIDSALDGVLFIDEAYSLIGKNKDDYGAEAISTLLKRMEDDRGRLVVILAGYTKEIKEFIDSNPGLQSRFNRYIEFPDYSAKELSQIFSAFAKKNQYALSDEAQEKMDHIMEAAILNKDKNFGNARFVRNLFEKTIERQAVRLSSVAPVTEEMLETIELCDLEGC